MIPFQYFIYLCFQGKLESLANYLTELALVDGQSFLKFSPSLLAASAVAMARHTLNLSAWPENLALKAGYTVGLDSINENKILAVIK